MSDDGITINREVIIANLHAAVSALEAENARLKVENEKVIEFGCLAYATIHEILNFEVLRTVETDNILAYLLSHMPDSVHKALTADKPRREVSGE